MMTYHVCGHNSRGAPQRQHSLIKNFVLIHRENSRKRYEKFFQLTAEGNTVKLFTANVSEMIARKYTGSGKSRR